MRRDRLTGALAESEARYRQLVDLSPEAIFVHRDNRLVLANDRCLSLLGATDRAQLIGRPLLSFVHPDDHAAAQTAIQQLLLTGKAVRFAERRFIRMDGTIVEVELTAALLRDRLGSAVQVILREIGDRKQIEAELRARTRQQEAVAALGQLALEEGDLDTLFGEAMRRIAETLGTEIVVVLELHAGRPRSSAARRRRLARRQHRHGAHPGGTRLAGRLYAALGQGRRGRGPRERNTLQQAPNPARSGRGLRA